MNIEHIFEEAKLLFEYFGWFALLLVLGTVLVMIPLNWIYKKIMKPEGLSRLRKCLSALSVYLVAMGLIALFTTLVVKKPVTLLYVMSTSLPCGFLAQVLWTIIKFVRDYGFAPLVANLSQNKEFLKQLKELGVSKKLVKIVLDNANAFIKEKDIKDLNSYVVKEFELSNKIRSELTGFVTGDINKAVTAIVSKVKAQFVK